jgi:glucose dehydrogenase
MPSKNYASTRYSELADVNAGNVASLQVTFTFATGVLRGHEAPPLVVGSTMYVLTPYPNILYALDLSQPGAPGALPTCHRRRTARMRSRGVCWRA